MICNFEELPSPVKQVFRRNKPKPCSWLEIIELEKKLGFNLPKMYREIFSQMGHGAEGFWAGEDCFYKHLPLIQAWAKELLIEDSFPISVGISPERRLLEMESVTKPVIENNVDGIFPVMPLPSE